MPPTTSTDRQRSQSKPRPAPIARRGGYVVAILVNLAILYLANRHPGWQAVPFLTADTQRVIGLFNASIVASIVVNAVFVLYDAPWLKTLGDLVTTVISLVVTIRFWQVFPFAVSDTSVDWALLFRSVLVVAMVGSAIGILAGLVSLGRKIASAV